MQVNILEAKNHLSELIKSAQAGEEVVIAKRGKPVVRLEPTEAGDVAKHERGSAQAILACLKRHPVPEYARRSAEEIDAYIREARASWD